MKKQFKILSPVKNNGVGFILKEKTSCQVKAKKGLFFTLFFLLLMLSGCRVIPPLLVESNKMSVAQKKILSRDYDGARLILTKIYERSELKTEKGEAVYWIAYTHIKESSYREARNFLDSADNLYRNGPLLGVISARVIACALLDGDEARANKQYAWIRDKKVGELPEINFIFGKYYQTKGELAQAKIYFQRCAESGDNFFARRASRKFNDVAEGSFYLQYATYSNMNSVNTISKKLKDDYSLDVYIKESKVNETKLYSLCVGKFSTRLEAEKELKNLKSRFRDLELIVRP